MRNISELFFWAMALCIIVLAFAYSHKDDVDAIPEFLSNDIVECKEGDINTKIYIKGDLVTCIPRRDNAVLLRW